jgi:hypothetical protein
MVTPGKWGGEGTDSCTPVCAGAAQVPLAALVETFGGVGIGNARKGEDKAGLGRGGLAAVLGGCCRGERLKLAALGPSWRPSPAAARPGENPWGMPV